MSEEEIIKRLKELKEEGAILGEDEVKTVLNLIEKQQKEIEHWKEQAEGYAQQIEEEYEQRLKDCFNEG